MGWLAKVHRDQARLKFPAKKPALTGKVLFCRLCGQGVLEGYAREHIRSCWKVELRPDEPLPMIETKEGVIRWIENHKIIETANVNALSNQ
jgi:hypothetical protein